MQHSDDNQRRSIRKGIRPILVGLMLAISLCCPMRKTLWADAESHQSDAVVLDQVILAARQSEWNRAADLAVGLDDSRVRAVTMAGIHQRTLDQVPRPLGNSLGRQTSVAAGQGGGGAQADFDTLIGLIEETVAPETWIVAGGEGTLREFANGVSIDPHGLLREVTANQFHAAASTPPTSARHSAAEDIWSRERSSRKRIRSHNPRSPRRQLRAVSLTRLERELQRRWARHEPIDDTLEFLAGLYHLHAIFAYPDEQEVVLIGWASDWSENEAGEPVSVVSRRPVVRLDDLVTHMRRVEEFGDARLGCSITPVPEHLMRTQRFLDSTASTPLPPGAGRNWLSDLRRQLGHQTVSVFGVPATTRVARVLVAADHHMKRIAMGLIPGPTEDFGYLDALALNDVDQSLRVVRWWFAMQYRAVATTADRLSLGWRGHGVVVRSENPEISPHGQQVATDVSDGPTEQFATRFTNSYSALANLYPIYADLQNQFALALVASALFGDEASSLGLAKAAGWSPYYFGIDGGHQTSVGPAPRTVDTIMNHRRFPGGVLIAGVSGGVDIEANVLPSDSGISNHACQQLGERLAMLRIRATPMTTQHVGWWWDLPAAPPLERVSAD